MPPDRGSFRVSLNPPELSACITLRWPQQPQGLCVSVYVDTGSPVDLVASPRLREMIRQKAKPSRMGRLQWGDWVSCEIYDAEALLDQWRQIEVYAPLEGDFEDLLGLPAILRCNLCIRGDAGAAFWVEMSDPRNPMEWVGRDRGVDCEPGPTPPRKPSKKRRVSISP